MVYVLSIRIHTHMLLANNEAVPTIDLHFLVGDTYKLYKYVHILQKNTSYITDKQTNLYNVQK